MDRVSGSKYGRDHRIPTESRPSKFYEHKQFRFFDRLDGVTAASQIVYKVTVETDIEVFERSLELWSGGREYLVYPDTQQVNFTGSLTPVVDRISNLNGIVKNGLPIPTTKLLVEKATGAGIFTTTDLPQIGTAVLTDGNSNRASSVYTPDSTRLGIPNGTVIWLVLNQVGASTATKGIVTLSYEEV